jgi:di/tricarboxylate transporter
MFGGVTTLIGTSTNLVVSSFMVNAGLPPLGMFDPFAWVGVPVALVCLVVMSLGARLLPANDANSREAQLAYFLEARVEPGSAMAGRSIEQNRLRSLDGLFLLEIVRDGRLISPVTPAEVLEVGDVLIFTGEIDKVQALQRFDGLQVFGVEADSLLRSNLVEVVVSSQSELANRTLRDVDFRTMFDAGVVGIRRGDKRLTGQLGRIPLRVGDSLLLAVGPDFSQHRNLDRNFHMLGGSLVRPRLTPLQNRLTLGGFALVVAALAAIGVLSLFSGLMLLMAALLLGRLLTLGEMRRRFPFDLVLVIGSALTIAQVLESSGAAALVAGAVRSMFDGHGAWGTLIGRLPADRAAHRTGHQQRRRRARLSHRDLDRPRARRRSHALRHGRAVRRQRRLHRALRLPDPPDGVFARPLPHARLRARRPAGEPHLLGARAAAGAAGVPVTKSTTVPTVAKELPSTSSSGTSMPKRASISWMTAMTAIESSSGRSPSRGVSATNASARPSRLSTSSSSDSTSF